jgi:uncharacterized protein YecT (DUF1311 family)
MHRLANTPYTVSAQFLLFTLLALCSLNAYALDCRKPLTTPEVNACADARQKRVEATLNAAYKRVLSRFERPDTESERFSEIKTKLIDAQRAWVAFREADCNAALANFGSGTGGTVVFIDCMQRHAERRIKDLKSYEE